MTDGPRSGWLVLVATLALAGLVSACNPESEPEQGDSRGRLHLTSDGLLGREAVALPVPAGAFEPDINGTSADLFEGHLTIGGNPSRGQIEVVSDLFGLAGEADLKLDMLPEISLDLIQSGNDLIPAQRGRQSRQHPHWEIVFEPGAVWDEEGDNGWSRASLPFALLERNANCTHNGLLMFLFKNDGSVSQAVYQVGSETCHYLQFNLWGVADARYQPHPIHGGEGIARKFREEMAARLPVRPLARLGEEFPDADISRFALHDPQEVSTFGLVIDGVHYSGGCPTRFGPYPFCDRLDLPSYSLAKTIFAGSVMMQLEQLFPGVGSLLVTDYVPECHLDGRWEGVTLGHLLDMSSGLYKSRVDQEDEFYSYSGSLFSAADHASKIADACNLFPRKDEPGTTWVYHTSETYIAGTLMNAFLREQWNGHKDIYTDLMIANILEPLQFSPTLQGTIRSYDDEAQPFTGYGLTLLPDDIARFGLFLLQDEGKVEGVQVLDHKALEAALQRDPEDPGMTVQAAKMRYNNGLWAATVMPEVDCRGPVWIPFMSGYGGISVVLMPNQSVYYVFSDGAHFKWAQAAIESNRLKSFCGEQHS